MKYPAIEVMPVTVIHSRSCTSITLGTKVGFQRLVCFIVIPPWEDL